MVGDGGQELSGGQAQRIVISRALVRKPTLLILDEATSGLDGGSAEVIRETVQKLKKREGMATLVVSHTAEMMKIAGRVVVMEEGEIVESGGFDELKNKVEGKFRTLVRDDSGDKVVLKEENDAGEASSNASSDAHKGGLGIRIPGYDEVEFHTGRDTPIRDARRRDTWLRQNNH